MDHLAADFPFQSHFVKVNGANIHYLDEGQGDIILLLHDMPMCNYLWRNIIPLLTPTARCIAPDLIGMGKSDRPEIAYQVFDHIDYIEGFIEALKLERVTLVMRGWSSVIGFEVARRHPEKIKGLAFFEAYLRPAETHDSLSLLMHELFAFTKTADGGYQQIMTDPKLIDKILYSATLRRYSEEELQHYRQPFANPTTRRVFWQYLQEIPLNKPHSEVAKLIENYSAWLQQTTLPKLLMYGVPGLITAIDTVQWALDHLPNLTVFDIGEAIHFPEEYKPEIIASGIKQWFDHL